MAKLAPAAYASCALSGYRESEDDGKRSPSSVKDKHLLLPFMHHVDIIQYYSAPEVCGGGGGVVHRDTTACTYVISQPGRSQPSRDLVFSQLHLKSSNLHF